MEMSLLDKTKNNSSPHSYSTKDSKLKEFEMLKKEYRAQKNAQIRKKIKIFFQHLLFFVFPCSCIKSEQGNKIVTNLIAFGLQTLGIITQISSFLFIYESCLVIFSNPTQFISKILSAVFIFIGGLYLRISSMKNYKNNQMEKSIIGICVCTILLFLIFYFNQ